MNVASAKAASAGRNVGADAVGDVVNANAMASGRAAGASEGADVKMDVAESEVMDVTTTSVPENSVLASSVKVEASAGGATGMTNNGTVHVTGMRSAMSKAERRSIAINDADVNTSLNVGEITNRPRSKIASLP
jgi:hypothetical protein